MSLVFVIATYVGIGLGAGMLYLLWTGYKGIKIGGDYPPSIVIVVLWPIALPILLLGMLTSTFEKVADAIYDFGKSLGGK
jgi:hypothetical protein